jgi:uncharacterized membrane protein
MSGQRKRQRAARAAQRQLSVEAVERHFAERRAITRTHGLAEEDMTAGQRAADAMARFGGSWTFIALFALVLLGWVGLNSWMLLRDGHRPFDPYPYILLNLMLSMLAAVQAPLILMAQNREAEIDRRSARDDYEVNLKAELEIMSLHEKVDALARQVERLVALQGGGLAGHQGTAGAAGGRAGTPWSNGRLTDGGA